MLLSVVFIIVFVIISIGVLGMLSNISTCKKLRIKTINEYINRKSTVSGYLSKSQLMSLGRIYKKRFKNNQTHKVSGVFYYGGGSSQTRWYELAINGMRVETIYKPYESVSISGCEFLDDGSFNKNLLCDFDFKKVDIEGVVHKNCFYVSKVNDFDIIDEIIPSLSLKKVINICKLDFWLLGLSVLFYFSLIPAISSPTSGTLIFLILCTLVSICATVFTLCHLMRGYEVKGTFKEKNIYIDELYDRTYVGKIDNVLIASQYPLINGNHYQAVLTDGDLGRTGLMYVDKLNGDEYKEGNTDGAIKLLVIVFLQFLLSCTYFLSSKDSIQEELEPLYNHNIERFDLEEFGKKIHDTQDFDNIKVNDYLTIKNIYYNSDGDYYILIKDDLYKNYKPLIYTLGRLCLLGGDTFQWINVANSVVEHVTFKFDSNNKWHKNSEIDIKYDANDYKMICDIESYEAVRLALCRNCSQSKNQAIKGVVTGIDYENRVVHLTKELEPKKYPNQFARYYVALVILLSSVIYLLIGFLGIIMLCGINRKNKSKEKKWVV